MIMNYYESGTTAVVKPGRKPPIEHDERNSRIRTKNNNKISYSSKLEKQQELQHTKQLKNEQTKKYTKIIFGIIVVFGILFLLCYQSSLVNTRLNEKEKLKTELSDIQKKNEQLKVNIEQKMNINTIEQEAKEKLGMQKIDNSQKVYINIDKNDYTESSILNDTKKTTNKSWWNQFLNDLFNKK